jgi:DNA-binding MarR family transcriptional regulator
VLSGVLLAEADQKNVAGLARHSADEILAHPRFPQARAAFVNANVAIYEHNPFLSRLLLESGRTALFIVIMCLDARHDRNDRATWPTLRLVTEWTVRLGVASPRRVYDLVRRLIATGYLEQRPAPQDRRTRIQTPTAKMIAHDQDFLASQYLPLQILFSEPGYGAIMRHDPDFQLAQRLQTACLFARGARIMAGDPAIRTFLGRDAGATILLKLMQMIGSGGDAAPLELSFAELGTRFGVSRTHVRSLLREAEAQGLVRVTSGDSPFVAATPALVEAFDRFVAESMAGHDLIYVRALARLAGTAPTGKAARHDRECPEPARRAEHRRFELLRRA